MQSGMSGPTVNVFASQQEAEEWIETKSADWYRNYTQAV